MYRERERDNSYYDKYHCPRDQDPEIREKLYISDPESNRFHGFLFCLTGSSSISPESTGDNVFDICVIRVPEGNGLRVRASLRSARHV